MQTIAETETRAASETFQIRSSIAEDMWHDDRAPASYEWWYFDAISDDGRDVLVIIFLTNFIFSPRYNRNAKFVSSQSNSESSNLSRFPAVTFCLYRDGRPLLRAINEHPSSEFEARQDSPACRIGRSEFALNVSSNDVSYDLTIDEPLRGERRLRANFSWQLRDGDFDASDFHHSTQNNARFDVVNQTHEWNMVAPRCIVSGAIRIENSQHQIINQYQFDGTGYHDHNRDIAPIFANVNSWQWGRAHFADDTTAIFYRYRSHDGSSMTKLLLVRDGKLEIHQANFTTRNIRRDIFGVRHAREMEFTKTENISLQISQHRVIDRSFFYMRFLSDATLKISNGCTLKARAITEHLAPRALKFRWLDWLVNMRIGRNGRTAFLP